MCRLPVIIRFMLVKMFIETIHVYVQVASLILCSFRYITQKQYMYMCRLPVFIEFSAGITYGETIHVYVQVASPSKLFARYAEYVKQYMYMCRLPVTLKTLLVEIGIETIHVYAQVASSDNVRLAPPKMETIHVYVQVARSFVCLFCCFALKQYMYMCKLLDFVCWFWAVITLKLLYCRYTDGLHQII